MKLYHGSDHVIKKPIYNFESLTSDYGYGFYMACDIELAKEWATNNGINIGIVNKYEIDLTKMNVLDLTGSKYSSLHWLALLVENRDIRNSSSMVKSAINYLKENYLLDLSNYDVVIGYRADDSYFSFVKSFLRNELDIDELEQAIKLGDLGKQYFIRSQKAFNELKFIGSEEIDYELYSKNKESREWKAKYKFRKMMNSTTTKIGKRIQDIIEGK